MSPEWQWLKDKKGGKPMKIEQRKVPGPEWEPQVKQTALLANALKKEEPKLSRGLLFSLGLLGWPTLTPHSRMYFPLLAKIYWAVTMVCPLLQISAVGETQLRKLQTPPMVHLAGMLMNSLVLNLGNFPGKRLSIQWTSFARKTHVNLEHVFPIISTTDRSQLSR